MILKKSLVCLFLSFLKQQKGNTFKVPCWHPQFSRMWHLLTSYSPHEFLCYLWKDFYASSYSRLHLIIWWLQQGHCKNFCLSKTNLPSYFMRSSKGQVCALGVAWWILFRLSEQLITNILKIFFSQLSYLMRKLETQLKIAQAMTWLWVTRILFHIWLVPKLSLPWLVQISRYHFCLVSPSSILTRKSQLSC